MRYTIVKARQNRHQSLLMLLEAVTNDIYLPLKSEGEAIIKQDNIASDYPNSGLI